MHGFVLETVCYDGLQSREEPRSEVERSAIKRQLGRLLANELDDV